MKKIAVVLTLAVALCFVMPSLAQAGLKQWIKNNLLNKNKAVAIPIWQITQDGNAPLSVNWVDHAPNLRFAIYDPGTPGVTSDDVVLDKETGLVWEREPTSSDFGWEESIYSAFNTDIVGRKGWRLPTIEELLTLFERSNCAAPVYLCLPTGHPFILSCETCAYVTSTTDPRDTTQVLTNSFHQLLGIGSSQKDLVHRMKWLVRGGQGHDTY
jgi:hypothetical protein